MKGNDPPAALPDLQNRDPAWISFHFCLRFKTFMHDDHTLCTNSSIFSIAWWACSGSVRTSPTSSSSSSSSARQFASCGHNQSSKKGCNTVGTEYERPCNAFWLLNYVACLWLDSFGSYGAIFLQQGTQLHQLRIGWNVAFLRDLAVCMTGRPDWTWHQDSALWPVSDLWSLYFSSLRDKSNTFNQNKTSQPKSRHDNISDP